MSFNWAEYHKLCETLLKSVPPGLEEATFRCVCSRAYYSAFCSSRDVARTLDSLAIAYGGIDHGIVLRHFKNHSDPQRRRIAASLQRLIDFRALADYDENAAITRGTAQSSVDLARNILDTLAKLTP